MQDSTRKRFRMGWPLAALLLAAGFIAGTTFTGGGADHKSPTLPALLNASAAMAQPLVQQSMSYADVAELTMPAVVNISTDKVVDSGWVHPFFDDPLFRRFFDAPRDNRERIQRSLGSGVVVSDDGYVLTNNHVIEKAKEIRVSFANNEEYKAEVIGSDPSTDVALIKIDAEDLPYLRFDSRDDLRVGDQVMAIGNPFGLGQTVTLGIVSALGRNIGLIDYEDLIQTDATINPGNSGGALVNMQGELVGMNTAILSRSGGSQGIGFAIPAAMAERIVTSLREHGKVERAWLGVLIQDVDQNLAKSLGLDKPRGVLISQVNADTPAEKAGLQEGDIVLAVDGDEVSSRSSLRNKISLMPVGHKARLQILRDDKEMEIVAELDEYPEDVEVAAGSRSDAELVDSIEGVTVRELTPQRRRMAGVPDDIEGIIVVDVDPGTPAAREQLEAGDVILEVNRMTVTTLDDFQEALSQDKDKPILLRVYKPQGGRIFMAIPR